MGDSLDGWHLHIHESKVDEESKGAVGGTETVRGKGWFRDVIQVKWWWRCGQYEEEVQEWSVT